MSKKGRTVSSSRALLFYLLTSFFLIPSHVQSQSSFGRIEGIIQDEAGAVLPGVTVTLNSASLMGPKTVVTNEKGIFRFLSLSKGTYVLTAELPGFAVYRHEGIRVRPGLPTKLVIELHIAGIEETITVTASAPVLQMRSAAVSQTTLLEHQPFRFQSGEFNTETYDRIVHNPFRRVIDQPLSTFSIDVDTASYSNARRFLTDYEIPPPDSIRIEEWINYFSYDYPVPEDDEPFSVNLDVTECPWERSHRLVRIGLKGKEIDDDERPSSNLVFLLDVSGSMEDYNKLPLVKKALRMLVARLDKRDRVTIVVYAGASGLVLPPTSGSDKRAIVSVLEHLGAGGSTNGGEGIQLAYAKASESYIDGGANRVILCTDGDFNVGVTNQGDLIRIIEKEAERGVFLSVLGFGMGNYKDSTLEKLADKGDGNYAYIDTALEARKVLVEQLEGTLVTIAKDVKIQVEFNPKRVHAHRLLGYENRILADEDFDDDEKDAGEIGAGHTVTALYEVVPVGRGTEAASVGPLKYQEERAFTRAASSDELLTVRLRYKEPDGKRSKRLEVVLAGKATRWTKASKDFKFAAAVASFGMLLRDSSYRGTTDWDLVLRLAKEGQGKDTYGYRRELIDLIELAQEIGIDLAMLDETTR